MKLKDVVIKPVHPEGWRFVAIFGAASAVAFLLWPPLGWAGVVLTLWCVYFFRDPVRVTPVREGLVVSPADGIVCAVGPATPPAELELGAAPRQRVGIFMSVFDCHVNRTPLAGTVRRIAYRPGKFVSASLDKAAEENERNGLAIELADGRDYGVVQIAGLVARRIVCFVEEGQALETGARFGLIRFGSRLDVYLPEGVMPLVAEGQTMIAGETVIADLASDEPGRAGRPA